VLRFAVPAGLICATASFSAYLLARGSGDDLRQERSVATICLFLTAVFVLLLVARPLAAWKLAMLGAIVAAFALVLTVPVARRLADLSIPDLRNTLVIAGVTLAAGAALYALLRRTGWIRPT
jgi:cation-transporting ATPase E